MLLVLSPSKTLDLETPYALSEFSQPEFLEESKKLAGVLKRMDADDIRMLMEISPKLAELNVKRFKAFKTPFTLKNARQALISFKGDVYGPMEVKAYGKKEFTFAQDHLRILSGLYGVLRPLDLMQPYRLEMGRKLAVGKTKDLYQFWASKVTQSLKNELSGHRNRILLNLASQEYAHVIDRKALGFPVVDVAFKEQKGNSLKIVALFAKQARGAMADFIIKNQIDDRDAVRFFNWKGYHFRPDLSSGESLCFVRKAS